MLPHALHEVGVRLQCDVEPVIERQADKRGNGLAQAVEVVTCLTWLIGHVMHEGSVEHSVCGMVELGGEGAQDREVR